MRNCVGGCVFLKRGRRDVVSARHCCKDVGLTVKGVDVGIGYVGVHVGFVSATPPVQGH